MLTAIANRDVRNRRHSAISVQRSASKLALKGIERAAIDIEQGACRLASTHRLKRVPLTMPPYRAGRRPALRQACSPSPDRPRSTVRATGISPLTESAFHASDVGLLIPMVLPATDHDHLRSVRSACLPAAAYFRAEPEWGAWLRAMRHYPDPGARLQDLQPATPRS